jgi:pantoate--beta-alanine ligase
MASLPRVLSTVQELQAWRSSVEGANIAFVPTMGALHEGHAQLLHTIRHRCELSVLSIFVNPTQFAPHEDLDRYPKSFESDLILAATEGVDVVFAPSAQELYPMGYSTFVEESHLSTPFCGPYRLGHFRGVTTIVLKLLNLIRPQLALFGLKDAQQFFILKKMVLDLNLEVAVEGMETVRASDGLALSSRNLYLSQQERQLAPVIYQTLLQIKDSCLSHSMRPKLPYLEAVNQSLSNARQLLIQNGFTLQYLDCLKLPYFDPLDSNTTDKDPQIIAVAAILGKTRLIDNVIFSYNPTDCQK